MANSSNTFNSASRAMLVGALFGGGASVASQWKAHQNKKLSTEQLCTQLAKDSLRAGLLAGGATYISGNMAGRPVLSMATILVSATASIYLMEQVKEK
jgi:hypothetical protein